MNWRVEYLKAALRDLERLDPYNRKIILKAIQKTAERPLSPSDGVGKPLGNHASSKLSGFFKIKLKHLGYRVAYQLLIQGEIMRVIVISIQDDDAVYKEVERRIRNFTE